MKVSLMVNNYEKSQETASKLVDILNLNNIAIDDQDPDVVITIGGDGTMLRAFHQWQDSLDKVRFVGIHTGHLGFYTDWRDYEIQDLVQSLVNDKGNSISYPLLELTVVSSEGKERFLALNESTVRQVNRTMVSEIFIGDRHLECFRGDGLSLATPTGSTGYNKSVGGAVMDPSLNLLQMTELASLNSRCYRSLGSPIIIGDKDFITIQVSSNEEHIITVDQNSFRRHNVLNLTYRLSDKRIRFIKYRHMDFWERVKEAFIDYEA